MAKFRKKPVVIEAVTVSGLLAAFSDRDFATSDRWPQWARDAFAADTLQVGAHSLKIRTLEGEMVGERADWIIRGVKGEIYPCKPDIFAATYEPVE
jgi:hypothetical protein